MGPDSVQISPPPWTAEPEHDDVPDPHWKVSDDNGLAVCGGLVEAEAHLIAAAPELEAAARGLLKAWRGYPNLYGYPTMSPAVAALEAALARTEGK